MAAKLENVQIFSTIRSECDKATESLASLFGEPPLLEGYGRRNTTTMAVAPTTSSSFILGQVSPSIEPLNSNYFVKDLAKGKFTFRSPHLAKLLKSKDKDTTDVWMSSSSVFHADLTVLRAMLSLGKIPQRRSTIVSICSGVISFLYPSFDDL